MEQRVTEPERVITPEKQHRAEVAQTFTIKMEDKGEKIRWCGERVRK